MPGASYTESWQGTAHYAIYEQRRMYVTPALSQLVGGVVEEYFSPGDTVLEVGAGAGALRRYAGSAADQINWIESEHTQEPLDIPRAIETERHIVALPEIPFADEGLDGIISLGVLDTLSDEDLEGTARSATRALKEGKHIVHLLDMSPDYIAEIKNAAARGLFPLPFNGDDEEHTLGLHYVAVKNIQRRVSRLPIDPPTKRVFAAVVADAERHIQDLNRTNVLQYLGEIAEKFGMVEETAPSWLGALGDRLSKRFEEAGLTPVRNEVIATELLVNEQDLPLDAQGQGITHITRKQGAVDAYRQTDGLWLPGKVSVRADTQLVVAAKEAA